MQQKLLNTKTVLIKPAVPKLLKVQAGQDWSKLTDKIRKGKPLTVKNK